MSTKKKLLELENRVIALEQNTLVKYKCQIAAKNKEIKKDEEYEMLSCDGDCIHVACKSKWLSHCDEIDKMTDEEFREYLLEK